MEQKFLQQIRDLGVNNIAEIDVEAVIFSEEIRRYCEMNTCGNLGKNWCCPPGVGMVAELKERVRQYRKGLVIQTVSRINSSFDWKGMLAAKNKLDAVMRQVQSLARENGLGNFLVLSAGQCTFCSRCTYEKNEPCRFPEKAMASIESFGIDVMKLAKDSGLAY
ncbi:MAG TPA: DUF2284 domain-containing protein, partial [Firmicutes bacterium]|nr:DUF2284 domain-containing protein [Bacillota bacterium]